MIDNFDVERVAWALDLLVVFVEARALVFESQASVELVRDRRKLDKSHARISEHESPTRLDQAL